MNKFWLYLVLIIIGGCSAASSNPNYNSGFVGNNCPEKPSSTLDSKDVKAISIATSGTTKESGQLNGGKSLGYTFEAQSGQKLSYQTKDDICIWIFTQDLTLLSNTDLPKSGKYTIQVAAPKGSTTFNLEMSLGTLQTSASPVSPNPQTTPNNTPNTPSSNSNSSNNSNSSGLTQDQASQLIANWLNSKAQIFSPPFDRQLVANYTTGPLYTDITKPGGSIDWLKNNSSRYDYRNSRITQVLSFDNSGSQPAMKVEIYEERTLYGPRGIDSNQSGSSTRNYMYFFVSENGSWKIYDYRAAE
ncbi:ARC6/PARC6 family protein [Microcoleus anatoxicus]|uniref:ARC6/PARC6 family protein n=1 Tax=Microcoleus anatoxicus TaxID=2705319 RepID=UPI0030C8FCFC